jgi:hypothetical protein
MHMNPTRKNLGSQSPKATKSRVAAAPRHLRCRVAVLQALRTTPPVPDDTAARRYADDKAAAAGPVVMARQELDAAAAVLDQVKQTLAPGTWGLRQAEIKVEQATAALRDALASARRQALDEWMPWWGIENTSAYWPWRGDGAPWVWCCDLLLTLPDWSHNAVREALQRAHAEGLVESSGMVPIKHAWAVRLTPRALQLDELVETLQGNPGATAVVLEALQAQNDDAEGGAQ